MGLRIKKAFELNLDNIADRFDGPEKVIDILNERAEQINNFRFESSDKKGDLRLW